MGEGKHKIKVLERDLNRKYVDIELDGERVRVEKLTEEEIKEWNEHLDSGKFTILTIRTGWIDFDYGSTSPFDKEASERVWRELCRRKALAVYRLLWYFGPPYQFATGEEFSCTFTLKYKGYVFEVSDRFGEHMWVSSIHLVTKEEFRKLETTERKRQKEYAPSEEIGEEILSIVEYLTKNPVTVYTDAGPARI